jgi:hypothetical protein
MHSNAAVYGVFELTDRDGRTTWSYFGQFPRRLSGGFPYELPWQEWRGWGWDSWPVDTLAHATNQMIHQVKWAERHLGYPTKRQHKVSIDVIESLREIITLQKEHGDNYEMFTLWEEPEILTEGHPPSRWPA